MTTHHPSNLSFKRLCAVGILLLLFASVFSASVFAAPNDTPSGADILTLGSWTQGLISPQFDVDWFRVSIPSTGTLVFDVDVPPGLDYDIQVYGPNSSTSFLGSSTLGTGSDERVSLSNRPAGTYFAKVFGFNNAWSSTALYFIRATFTATNAPPSGSANQYREDTQAVIPFGSTVPEGVGIIFKSTVSDPDGDSARLEVELRQLPFNPPETLVSGFVGSGQVASTSPRFGLVPGNYGWRHRIVDSRGGASNWSTEGNPDFIVVAIPNVTVSVYRISDTSGTPNTTNPGATKSTFNRGETVRVTLQATNTGGSAPVQAVLNLFPSGSNTPQYDSYPLGQNNSADSPLTQGETDYYSFDWTIPSNAPTGLYDILAAIRDQNNFNIVYDETAPGANTTSFGSSARLLNQFTVTVPLPDLLVQGSVTASPNPVTAGNNVTISYTVRNQGDGNAGTSTTRIQIRNASTNVLLIDDFFPTPAVGAKTSINESRSINIPASAPGGAYTVYIVLDSNNMLGQSDTSNDFANGPLTITVATITWTTPPPSSITSGQPFSVAWSVSGGTPTHINIHWDPTNPGGPGNPGGNINPGTCVVSSTSCSTDSPTSSPVALTAPTVSSTGFPVTVQYRVHAVVNGTDVFSDVRSVIVNPSPANPTITTSLRLLESPPYIVGQTLTAQFTIKNLGGTAITFAVLTVGGRLNGSCPTVSIFPPFTECPDFTFRQGITLNAGESYNYQGTLTLQYVGNYNFFTAYRLPDGTWNIAIPTATGITNTLDISVSRASISVTSPNAGDEWPIGSRQTIRWTSEGLTHPSVNIDLSRDGGLSWPLPLATNHSKDKPFEWVVTGPPCENNTGRIPCKIRVTGFVGTNSVPAITDFTMLETALKSARKLDGSEMDLNPLGTRTPLILIYGWRGDELTWDDFVSFLGEQPQAALLAKVKPYLFFYDARTNAIQGKTPTIFNLGGALRDRLQECYEAHPPENCKGQFDPRKSILVLAHSMGGLVARSLMQEHWFTNGPQGGERILRLITLGTLHHGTPAANFAPNLIASDYVQDLRWDDYNDDPAILDVNSWLRSLNCLPEEVDCERDDARLNFYGKVFAYAGIASRFTLSAVLQATELVICNAAFGFRYCDGDGLVPLQSSLFLDSSGVTRAGAVRTYANCDHHEMASARCSILGDGEFLFPDIASDLLNALQPDGTLANPSAGGTVSDTGGTVAAFSISSGVLSASTAAFDVFIEVLSDPSVALPVGFTANGTKFVDIRLDPNPSPLPLPGATITLPLKSPLQAGTKLSLFKLNPATGSLEDQEIVGAVDTGETTATFRGVTSFSTFVAFQPENHPPVLATNAGLTVNESATGTITTAQLLVTDVDNTPTQLTYAVTTLPSNGSLRKSGVALAVNGTFTQADINSFLITYQHSGSETTSDSFAFTVSDGAGGSIGATVFNITVTPVNDAPVLDNSVTMMLTSIAEDTTNPAGDTVASILATGAGGYPISDADSGALRGVAVTAADNSNGSWQYSTNGGTSWTAFGGASSATARLLTDDIMNRIRFVPNADFNGTATISFRAWDQTSGTNAGLADTTTSGGPTAFSSVIATAQIAVLPVNDPPVANTDTKSTFEDTVLIFPSMDLTANDSPGPENESGQTLTVTGVNSPSGAGALVFLSGGSVTYNPPANFNGTDSFNYTVCDNGIPSECATGLVNVNVTPVNDAPSFTKGADQTVPEDAGLQTVIGWATAISAGPPDESSQVVDFVISNSNNGLFSVQPAISPTGTLTYTPAPNTSGSATVTVQLHDNGGIANGGVDTSVPQTFTISVLAVNDPPSFVKGANQTVLEDAGPQTVPGWATAISAGPPNEAGQTLTFLVTNNNNALFSAQPGVLANGTLAYTSALNANGVATVTVRLQDNGGTTNGGVDISAPQTFTITVIPVNDNPVFNTIQDKTTKEGELLEFTVSATDVDGDSLSYSANWLPEAKGAKFDPLTRTFSYRPTCTAVAPGATHKTFDVFFEVSDGKGGLDKKTVRFTVTEACQPVIAVTNQNGRSVTLVDGQSNSVMGTLGIGKKPSAAAFFDLSYRGFTPPAKLYVAERERNEHEGDDDDDRRGDHGRDDDDDEEDGHHKGAVDVLLGPLSPNTASAFNFALGTIVDVGKRPEGLAIRPPDGKEVWVTNRNDDSISIIDGVADNFITTISLKVREVKGKREQWREIGKRPVAIAFSPDGKYAYVLGSNSDNLIVLDAATRAILSYRVEVGKKPVALAVSTDGSKLYIANRSSNDVAVVDVRNPASPVLLDRIRVGAEPEGVALTNDGTKLYVTSSEADSVWVYDVHVSPPYLIPRPMIPVGKRPSGITVTKPGSFPDGDYVYVAVREDNKVWVIDATNDTPKAIIRVGKGPKGLAAGLIPTAP